MAIMLREFIGGISAKTVGDYGNSIDLKESAQPKANVDALAPNSLMVEIEGLHAAPFATGNYTRYTAKALKASIPSWTSPYRRPLLKHHNEDNGEPIGRVISAEYVTKNTRSGTPALKFLVNVPDKDAIEGVKNGLLLTTSVGVTAYEVKCSICGAHITNAEEGCPNGHNRGDTYEGETCYWDIENFRAKEISYVDVPSDMYAKNLNYYPAVEKRGSETQIKESLDDKLATKKGEEQMEEKLKEAEAKIADFEKKVADLAEEKKASESKAVELEESVKALNEKITELEKTNAELKESLDESVKLKETLESEIANTKAELKESVTDTFLTLREALGRKVADVETIKARSLDSLKDSIVDMKESFTAQANSKAVEMKESQQKDDEGVQGGKVADLANSIKNPAAVDVKESEQVTNSVDLKAGLQNIFSSVMAARC